MENVSLDRVGEPDRLELLPGLFVEDKLRVKTQRRLEKQFKEPIRRIFPGAWRNPKTQEVETWPGVNFEYLDNLIPLLTILGKQVNENLTEEVIENALDSLDNLDDFGRKLRKYCMLLSGVKESDESANSESVNPTQEDPVKPTGE